ncbi:MAG: hypothetical protein JW800_05325 [Candidatus Omnitrophica bacterium]|nr:hypothetical protein [Candidatus Omnitrophota bacterium]
MKKSEKYLMTAILLCFFSLVINGNAYCAWRPKPKIPVKAKIRASHQKTYNYIRSHDYNLDGKVDAKDRLLWLRQQKHHYDTVYVSTENEDIVEAMDSDGDGDVETWEMEEFYSQYDTNGNGTLEDEEIEAALD